MESNFSDIIAINNKTHSKNERANLKSNTKILPRIKQFRQWEQISKQRIYGFRANLFTNN